MRIQALALLGWVGLVACSDSPGTQAFERGPGGGNRGAWARDAAPAVSVRAYRVERQPISTYILANTSLESIRKVTIYARLNALVQNVSVEEGMQVREGQVLARLDDTEIRMEYAQAQIALDQAQLALQQTDVRAQLSAANYERARTLYEQNLISRQEYDQVSLTTKTDDLGVQTARQQLAAARSRLAAAEVQLGYTDVVSTISGVVTERLIEVGDRINVNQATFVVEDVSPLWARIFVPERDLPRLRLGQGARLRVETFPDQQFEGAIKLINPTVDPTSGTVKVTVEVWQRGNLLRPGMFGTVLVPVETRPDAVVVPRKAIVRERDQNFVFVVQENGTASRRPVTLGVSEDTRMEVISGLSEGEGVVTVGYEGLSDGYAVQILSWENLGSEPVAPEVPQWAAQPSAPSPAGASQTAERTAAGPAGTPGDPPVAAPGRGRGGAGFGGPVSPERIQQLEQRLLSNPEIRKEYDARLKQDPGLAENPEKKMEFFREVMQRQGQGGRRPQ